MSASNSMDCNLVFNNRFAHLLTWSIRTGISHLEWEHAEFDVLDGIYDRAFAEMVGPYIEELQDDGWTIDDFPDCGFGVIQSPTAVPGHLPMTLIIPHRMQDILQPRWNDFGRAAMTSFVFDARIDRAGGTMLQFHGPPAALDFLYTMQCICPGLVVLRCSSELGNKRHTTDRCLPLAEWMDEHADELLAVFGRRRLHRLYTAAKSGVIAVGCPRCY